MSPQDVHTIDMFIMLFVCGKNKQEKRSVGELIMTWKREEQIYCDTVETRDEQKCVNNDMSKECPNLYEIGDI